MPLEQVAIHLHPADDVAIARFDLQSGISLDCHGGGQIETRQAIPGGHKVALCAVDAGGPVRRYGQVIGFATQPIAPGDHVHSHNLGMGQVEHDYAFGVDVQPVGLVPEGQRRTFMGYHRPDGRVGTRNTIAVISSVNCSADAAWKIARHFTPERLSAYPNVDGVIALVHQSGCSFRLGGDDYMMLQRTLAGMATHPNVGGYLFVGLGCETNQIGDVVAAYGLKGLPSDPPAGLAIQDGGGLRKTVAAGIAAVEAMLPVVNRAQRAPQPISGLTLALHCGGSDGWSGVTANPTLGLMSDELVRQGGAVLLGEVPEIYGAEQLLTRRAVSREVGEKLLAQIRWWEAYAARIGAEIDNNPSPGNKKGGLTTIYEKSLGAIAKGGHTPLTGVYEYAERVTARGVGVMNTPGNDWIGLTGQVAGGCNLIVFTTGRGSVLGFKPAPVIKVSTNTPIYERMADDMDLNAGQILDGVPMQQVADDLLDLVVAVASGQRSKSEAQDVGELSFCPWSLGGVL
ncbi:MAG: altronate dehydratase [Anaerolineae bacterium]|nr:altronate dehydratase [Anaerolineae bacterium]